MRSLAIPGLVGGDEGVFGGGGTEAGQSETKMARVPGWRRVKVLISRRFMTMKAVERASARVALGATAQRMMRRRLTRRAERGSMM